MSKSRKKNRELRSSDRVATASTESRETRQTTRKKQKKKKSGFAFTAKCQKHGNEAFS